MTPTKRDLFRDVLNQYELFNLPKPCPYTALKIITTVPDKEKTTQRHYLILDSEGRETRVLTQMFTRIDPATGQRHSIVVILEKQKKEIKVD